MAGVLSTESARRDAPMLSAMALVAQHVPNLAVRIMGPTDEDPEYAVDCAAFADELGLTDVVRFEGPRNLADELDGVGCHERSS